MKQWISLLLTVLLLCTPAAALAQPSEEELSIGAPSAILIERETGTVLYEKNADERLSPASVTKIMTLLLIFEQLDSGRLSTDTVVTASANACAMGGSRAYLRLGGGLYQAYERARAGTRHGKHALSQFHRTDR